MKKLIFPLLLMLAIGMLAAVESDPSNVVGYVKYPMVVGYNAAALPMDQGLTNTTEIGLIFEDDVNTIMVWNQDAQGWDAAVNYYGGFWDPEFDVNVGDMIYCTNDVALDFYSIGDLPEPATYSFVVGYNTAMVPLNRSDFALTTDVGVDMGDDVNTLMVWNQDAQGWDAAVNYYGGFWDPEFDVQIGTPLYLTVDNAFDWPSRAALNNSLFKTKF